ncbi:MAG: hypothetical protein NZZ41_07530 [Candidatus Dojkabacteria bacterium]|nr:hypothetical protein [Candidatus Dojkabacteria bacterium]
MKDYIFRELDNEYYYEIISSRYYFVRAESVFVLDYYAKRDPEERIVSKTDKVTKRNSVLAIERAKKMNISAVFASDSPTMVFCYYLLSRYEDSNPDKTLIFFVEPDIIQDSLTKTKFYSENEIIINPDTSSSILYVNKKIIEQMIPFMYVFAPSISNYTRNMYPILKYYEPKIDEMDEILLRLLAKKRIKNDILKLVEFCAFSIFVKLSAFSKEMTQWDSSFARHTIRVVQKIDIPDVLDKKEYVEKLKIYLQKFLKNPNNYEIILSKKEYKTILDLNEFTVVDNSGYIDEPLEVYLTLNTIANKLFTKFYCKIILT